MDSGSQQNLALLRLFFTPKIGGRVSLRKILEKRGRLDLQELENLIETLSKETGRWEGIPVSFLKGAKEEEVRKRAEREWEWLQKNGVRMVSILDTEYPPLLRNIYDPPAVLFFRGNFRDWMTFTPVAFVGTRRATDYGRRVVETLIEGLAGASVLIVSGFAKGIDTFAHRAAMKAGLPTVGILGTGLDTVYPAQNKELAERMEEKGALITQFPSGTLPLAWNFPERNRVIGGISKAVVVVEAPSQSGALLTAEFAMEEGREVLAVPGNIFSETNQGCHRLIGQGARLVGSAQEILEELKIQGSSPGPKKADPLEESDLNLEERALLQKLCETPLHIDKITEMSNLAPSSVASSLTVLVLKGMVQEMPGKFFMRSED